MTHPEISLSRVSLFLRTIGTLMNADFADKRQHQRFPLAPLARVGVRLSASKIKFEVNYVSY